ncbi:MAG: hypothetical protein U5J63_07965 [Fodinibius sp.]|nr:hypothetical protein [Fodinibius sp.]
MSEQESLVLNMMRFEHSRETIKAGFYKSKGEKRRMAPLRKFEFPDELNLADDIDRLYTDFKLSDDADHELEINLHDSAALAKHYYNRIIFGLFKGVADVRKLNFIHNNELWFWDEAADDGCSAYKRFELRTSIERYTNYPELLINYKGHSFLYPRPVIDYEGPTTDLNWVVYRRILLSV